MPPRLVRKAPLVERVKAYLDPWDWCMWLSEELNSSVVDWHDFSRHYSLCIGLALNAAFVVARASCAPSSAPSEDLVFGDHGGNATGWFACLSTLLVYLLALLAFANGWWTFHRRRHYRLFEQPIEAHPSTPSAHRVQVESSPSASSPLRFLRNMLQSQSAESRAYPDAARQVWEIAVWDPNPLALQLFCLFSPGHVINYCMFLPVRQLDPYPSLTVFTAVAIAFLLSMQLLFLSNSSSQQAKDTALIHKEVFNEYDKKFVHPSLQTPARDVGTQTPPKSRPPIVPEVDTYTPTTVINRGFHTNPNQSYAWQYNPNNYKDEDSLLRFRTSNASLATPSLRPAVNGYTESKYRSTATNADMSSPLRPSNTPNPFREHQFRQSQVGSGDGGSLGVYTHAASPLRKAASTNHIREDASAHRRRDGSPTKREGSPLKRMSTPGFSSNIKDDGRTGRRADREPRERSYDRRS